MSVNKLRTLSLFSGVGGIELGLERTGGFETVAFCEMDKHCQLVLNTHWPEIPIHENILTLDASSLKGKVDVITGGWPCQGFSVAGKKKGMSDGRSGLWKEVKRVTQEIEPAWVLFENSANLRNLGLAEVLQDLWSLGYRDIRWDVLPASAYGALHRRERIWIIANRNGIRLSQEALAPAQEESVRRAEAWIDFSNRRCPEPRFYGVDDEPPSKLDESERKRRVAMCGNSVYNVIAEYIGRAILESMK
jgi:DNA (cytosine-5)-methyltransferase 1